METFKLKRVKQCSKCPWKVSTNPFEIPDGYCPAKHAALKDTIAEPHEFFFSHHILKSMACHHSNGNDKMYCVGWLNHQLGIGNNIGLRMQMRHCENIRELKTVGEQHKKFEDTLPKQKLQE